MPSVAIVRARPSCTRTSCVRPDARVVVEFEPQSRIEGEIQQLELPTSRSSSSLRWSRAATRGRASDAEVTIFDSVGFALQDFSALRYLHRLHQQRRGTRTASTWFRISRIRRISFGGLVPGADAAALPSPVAEPAAHPIARSEKTHDRVARRTLTPHRRSDRRGRGGARAPPWGPRPAGCRNSALRSTQRGLHVVDRGNLAGPGNPRHPPVDGHRHLQAVAGHGTGWRTRPCTKSCASGGCPSCSAAITRLGIGSISAVARHCRESAASCACCGWTRMRISTPANFPRAAICTACRSRACAASGRGCSIGARRRRSGHPPAVDTADRRAQRR